MAIGTRVLQTQSSIAGLCNFCGGIAKPAYTCNICGATVCLSCFNHNIGACKKCVKTRFDRPKQIVSSNLKRM